MITIYIIGHGVMSGNKNNFGTVLRHKFITYCRDGKFFGAGGLPRLVDGGDYAPEDTEERADTERVVHNSGDRIARHWNYSRGMNSMADLKPSDKFKSAGKSLRDSGIQLDGEAGFLFYLDEATRVYSGYSGAVLTALDTIQRAIEVKLTDTEFELHWACCRSIAAGTTDAEVLEVVKDTGMEGEGLKRII